jgi:hypothetical protein
MTMPDQCAGNKAERSEAFELKLAVDMIRPLVERYEAVRTTPGHARDEAARLLGIALARHHSPVRCGGWIYRWYREEESITRKPAETRMHPAIHSRA